MKHREGQPSTDGHTENMGDLPVLRLTDQHTCYVGLAGRTHRGDVRTRLVMRRNNTNEGTNATPEPCGYLGVTW